MLLTPFEHMIGGLSPVHFGSEVRYVTFPVNANPSYFLKLSLSHIHTSIGSLITLSNRLENFRWVRTYKTKWKQQTVCVRDSVQKMRHNVFERERERTSYIWLAIRTDGFYDGRIILSCCWCSHTIIVSRKIMNNTFWLILTCCAWVYHTEKWIR